MGGAGSGRKPFHPVVDGKRACNFCLAPKPYTADYFPSRPNGKLFGHCLDCHRQREYARQEVPEYYARHKASSRRWTLANLDRAVANRKAWGARNPEAVSRLQRAGNANRKARKLAAEGFYGVKDVRALYRDQDGRCLYCGADLSAGFHVDHMTPLARGGSNWPENLCLTDPRCNLSKGDQTAEEFIGRVDPIARAA